LGRRGEPLPLYVIPIRVGSGNANWYEIAVSYEARLCNASNEVTGNVIEIEIVPQVVIAIHQKGTILSSY
jgi:hypothetical protein